jgi:hypothetical protein
MQGTITPGIDLAQQQILTVPLLIAMRENRMDIGVGVGLDNLKCYSSLTPRNLLLSPTLPFVHSLVHRRYVHYFR